MSAFCPPFYSVRKVTAFDGHGGSVDRTFNWTVTNPAPVARADSGEVFEDGPSLTVSAANGVIGSGGAAGSLDSDPDGDELHVTRFTTNGGTLPLTDNVGGSVKGAYGTLTLNADGSYTYVLDNDNADVNALKDGDTLSDVFVYEISDGEGGTDTATLTITVNGRMDGEPTIMAVDHNGPLVVGDATVHESGLTSDGPPADTSIATGTIVISAPDGLSSVTIGGASGLTLTLAQLEDLTPATPAILDTPSGRLVLTAYTSSGEVGGVSTGGSLSYEYVLETEVSSTMPGNDSVTEGIPLSVTDRGGSTTGGSLLITIVDDTPSFGTIESLTLYENDLPGGTSPDASGLVKTGNISVRTGADADGFDITLDGAQTSPAGLTSGGQPVTYSISGDGHTLTATAGGVTVFTLTIVDPTTATPEYRFELFRPLDNNGDSDLAFAILPPMGTGIPQAAVSR